MNIENPQESENKKVVSFSISPKTLDWIHSSGLPVNFSELCRLAVDAYIEQIKEDMKKKYHN